MASERPRNRRRPYVQSGFYSARRALTKWGSKVLPSPSTAVGRELRDWRLALIEDLGGEDQVTTAQLALVDEAVVQKLVCASISAFVLSMPSPINKRSRCLFPILRERAAQVGALQSLLRDLGLERRSKEIVPELEDYIQAADQKAEPPAAAAPANGERPGGDGGGGA